MALDYRTQANLRDLLAKLYYRDPDIERVVVTVGLDPSIIAWDLRPVNTWQSVLTEADFQNKVMAVIELARKEKPGVQSLELAEKDALLAITTPDLSEKAWHGPTDSDGLEKITGSVSSLRPIGFLQRGLDASRSVCRVELANGSSGSGFLIKGNLLITNNHVLKDPAAARTARAQFNYQKSPEGLDEPVTVYDLDPDQVFHTSKVEDEGGDDWTVVKVKPHPEKGNPADNEGTLPLVQQPDGTPKQGDEVIIIQHPGGGQKQIALSHNLIVYADQKRLQYMTDTLEGSSGSPVFNTNWQVVGLHHKGGFLVEPGSKQKYFRNQGVHVNVVIKGLMDKGLL